MKLHLTATMCHLSYGITVLPVTWHKWTVSHTQLSRPLLTFCQAIAAIVEQYKNMITERTNYIYNRKYLPVCQLAECRLEKTGKHGPNANQAQQRLFLFTPSILIK